MKLKTVEITELKGVNLNAVEGVTQTQPTVVQAFELDRAGGYRARFGQQFLSISGTFDGTIVGSDDAGLVSLRVYDSSTSFPRGRVTMRVYDATSTVQEVVDGFDGTSGTANVSTSDTALKPVHLPGTGIYVYSGDERYDGPGDTADDGPIYLVKDTGGTWRDSVTTESASVSTSSSINTSGSTFNQVVEFFGGFSTQAGTFLWPADNETVSGTFDEATATLTYSGAPDDWVVYAFCRQGSTNNVIYDIGSADASGSFAASLSSASAIFQGGVQIGVMTPPVVLHRERTFGLFDRELGTTLSNAHFKDIGGGEPFFTLTKRLPRNRTVWYTEIGYANLWLGENYFVVPFQASTEITGMASSPAGLLIFGNNETFLMRSDPSLSDFGIQIASGVIGMDAGTRPVRLGGTVFAIYKGEVYAFALGMGDVDFGQGIQKISDPIYDPSSPVMQIAAEPETRTLVASTGDPSVSGELAHVYRFDAEKGQWLTSVFDQNVKTSESHLFSNPDSNGARLYVSLGNTISTEFGSVGSTPTPNVKFSDVDLGDKSANKLWRRVRLQMNDGYSGTPTLDWNIGGTSGTVTGSEESYGRFIFTLPNGLVAPKADVLKLNLVDMTSGDTVEPPLSIEFVERYRRR